MPFDETSSGRSLDVHDSTHNDPAALQRQLDRFTWSSEVSRVPPDLSNPPIEPVWSLPLYQNYTPTAGNRVDITHDDNVFDLPKYEHGHSADLLGLTSLVTPEEGLPRFIVADESTLQWEHTILDNLHKLKRISDSEYTDAVSVKVHFTSGAGQVGRPPKPLDKLNLEYKQGDMVCGYVLVENTSDAPVPFDMLYVVLEGQYVCVNVADDMKETEIRKKFLEMYDFGQQSSHVDPFDNSCLSLEKTLEPKVQYKRFFTFKVPSKLLDSTCSHSLQSHVGLPSSLGLTKQEKKYNLKNFLEAKKTKVRDFSFINVSISYGVRVSIVGKSSMYGDSLSVELEGGRRGTTIINSIGDEFLILKEQVDLLRIIPNSNKLTFPERMEKYKRDKLMFDNFNSRLDDHIFSAEETIKKTGLNIVHVTEISYKPETAVVADELAKCRQLYKPRRKSSNFSKADCPIYDEDCQEQTIFFPMQRRSITGASKFLGTVIVTTPIIPYTIKYIEPSKFRLPRKSIDNPWFLDIPINMEYLILQQETQSKKLIYPEIKKVGVELVVLTLKSDNGPIPFELNSEMIFNNTKTIEKTYRLALEYNSDDLQDLIIEPIRKNLISFKGLIKS